MTNEKFNQVQLQDQDLDAQDLDAVVGGYSNFENKQPRTDDLSNFECKPEHTFECEPEHTFECEPEHTI